MCPFFMWKIIFRYGVFLALFLFASNYLAFLDTSIAINIVIWIIKYIVISLFLLYAIRSYANTYIDNHTYFERFIVSLATALLGLCLHYMILVFVYAVVYSQDMYLIGNYFSYIP